MPERPPPDPALFSSDGPDGARVEKAVAALGVRLAQEDVEKVAENIALLTRHRQVLAAALAAEAS